jgi:hypothetical protein
MTTPATEMGIELPDALEGHWETSDGREMAQRYASQERSQLCHGDMPDMALANAIYMADRNDLDLIGWQTAAKERIRWLSAQLALATRAEATCTPEAAQVEMLREALIETQDTIRDAANGGEPRFGELWRKIDAALAQVRHPSGERK